MALLNRNLWRGEAYAGLYVLKDLYGSETTVKCFSKSDIKFPDCKPPSYIRNSNLMYFKKYLGYQESIDNKWWIRYDVALITLDSPFDISLPQINPICLPKPKMPFDMDELYQEQLRIIGIAI